ncbi:MAG: UDP-N-acetylmuramoyl-L-alanine--D-glutamate ligase [Thermodesulfobacteriota bacterium]
MEFANKHIVVVGLGKTGEALCRFLVNRGAAVTATDRNPADALGDATGRLAQLPVRLELGGHNEKTFTAADMVVVSPGVAHTIAPIAAAKAAGVAVIGEIELAWHFISAPIVAVTGTNGKSTVTALIGEMLSASGVDVFVGGNIGTPLIAYADGNHAADAVVAEISSFQLDTIVDFRPRVGVLLNITADHLDRYADFDAYARSKARLFENQQPGDTAVLNGADAAVVRVSADAVGRKCFFYPEAGCECGAFIDDTGVTLRMPETGEIRIRDADIPLVGRHNRENAAAAALAALAAGGDTAGLFDGLRGFVPDFHRMQYVATIDGVAFYDDSKATNVDAAARAIEAVDGPVVLIAGGRDKGGGYSGLRPVVQQAVKTIVVLGEAAQNIADALGDLADTRHAATMTEAVYLAASAATAGDTVLLSPACASFDMYDSYARRGEDFQQTLRSMAETGIKTGAKADK